MTTYNGRFDAAMLSTPRYAIYAMDMRYVFFKSARRQR